MEFVLVVDTPSKLEVGRIQVAEHNMEVEEVVAVGIVLWILIHAWLEVVLGPCFVGIVAFSDNMKLNTKVHTVAHKPSHNALVKPQLVGVKEVVHTVLEVERVSVP